MLDSKPSPPPPKLPDLGLPRPPTFLDGMERVLIRVILVALVVLALLVGFATWHSRQKSAGPAANARASQTKGVMLVIDFGNGIRKTFPNLPTPPGATVLDAMNAAKSHAVSLAFTATGSGDTTLLTSIDGVKNEGVGAAAGQSRNWQYWIDGTYGMASIGVAKVNAGQRISWAFRPYDSDPKPPPP